jgi:EAL domain-containing protein (putative c-di-GMP-specific phosphodiesterase class I)
LNGRGNDLPDSTEPQAEVILQRLRKAVAVQRTSIRPAFQRIVALADCRAVAENALARIVTPEGRVLNASAFVEVAAQLNLLHRIDEMLITAAVDHHHLSEPVAGHKPCFVHVSVGLMRESGRLRTLVETLDGASIDAERLVLTVDERQVIEQTDQVSDAPAGPLRRGCVGLLTGFGGAHASYWLLSRLPVSFLEIDPQPVALARGSQQARNVLISIRQGAGPLGVKTLAKCVEHEADAALLPRRRTNCHRSRSAACSLRPRRSVR